MARLGTALDCAAMFVRKGIAVEFCERYTFPKQKSCHYKKYGGDEPANTLIREYARKGNDFCSLWCASECEDDYRFSEEDIEGYKPGLDFLDWMCSLPAASASFAAGMDIVNWRPRAVEMAV